MGDGDSTGIGHKEFDINELRERMRHQAGISTDEIQEAEDALASTIAGFVVDLLRTKLIQFLWYRLGKSVFAGVVRNGYLPERITFMQAMMLRLIIISLSSDSKDT